MPVSFPKLTMSSFTNRVKDDVNTPCHLIPLQLDCKVGKVYTCREKHERFRHDKMSVSSSRLHFLTLFHSVFIYYTSTYLKMLKNYYALLLLKVIVSIWENPWVHILTYSRVAKHTGRKCRVTGNPINANLWFVEKFVFSLVVLVTWQNGVG